MAYDWPLDNCLRCGCPPCVTLFSHWLFSGINTTGTWDGDLSVWTPSGPLDNTANQIVGDGSDLGSVVGAVPILAAGDLGGYSGLFDAPGIWIPQGDFVLTFEAIGTTCEHTADVYPILIEGVAVALQNTVSQSFTVVYAHPLGENVPFFVVPIRAHVDSDDPWGVDFTLYVGDPAPTFRRVTSTGAVRKLSDAATNRICYSV